MAKKENLRQILTNFESKCRRDCVLPVYLACPVFIDFCDASADGNSFSEATVNVTVDHGFPLSAFQLAGIYKLLSYLKLQEGNHERSAEIARLEDFFANKQHEECLLSLVKNKEYNDYNVQVILAAHLFGPLAGGYEIGNKGFPKDARRCPRCNKDISDTLKNTSLGNGNVWHGYADILMKRSVVKIGTKEDRDDDSVKPSPKKLRTEDLEDDESSASDEDSVIVEVTKDAFTAKAMSQVFSQTIVNAYAEVNKNQTLYSSYIPSFFASSQSFRLTLYNCESDSLILSDNIKIFMYVEQEIILNVSTILSTWYALNFDSCIDKGSELFPKFEKVYQKSNFKEQAGNKFEIYDKKCTKPMTEAVENIDNEMFVSLDFSTDYLRPAIEVSRSLFSHENS